MLKFSEGEYDVVVIGAGHAGCEAALAAARLGLKTAMLTLNLDSIAFMACNPSIGGTGKGHIVREIDALGGEMAKNADKCAIQARVLNAGKGEAVRSPRCQCDKNAYHREMKKTLENTPNLKIVQCEATEILTDKKKVVGVMSAYGGKFGAKAVIVATGVYLNAQTITGELRQNSGPNGFAPATKLTKSLIKLGFKVRRFKTGTPARLDGRSVDFEKCAEQCGDEEAAPFSFLNDGYIQNVAKCYLTYTNSATHKLILDNLDRAPLYNGGINSTGPRYCPSIETKVVRFADKDRHQIFLEPEGTDTDEVYVQGMSTSLPHDIQKLMYRTVAGLERCEIMRYAYAIEYDCIDSLDIYPTLEYKKISGLYTAGQINGTSGYEEAAAQGLMAGINAARKIKGEQPLILGRDEAYIGVMIDDLTTKGTEEPYRIMTSRAEFRIALRHDTADLRLTPKVLGTGLVSDERAKRYLKKKLWYGEALEKLNERIPPDSGKFLESRDIISSHSAFTYADLIRRGISADDLVENFKILTDVPKDIIKSAETTIKYEGYLKKNAQQVEKAKKLEDKKIPDDINYDEVAGLRLEAREQLKRVRPLTLGQAGRIYGVNPADVTVLIVYMATRKN